MRWQTKAIAASEGRSIGGVAFDLARQTLHRREPVTSTRNGLPIFPSRGKPGSVTLELVNRLRDALP